MSCHIEQKVEGPADALLEIAPALTYAGEGALHLPHAAYVTREMQEETGSRLWTSQSDVESCEQSHVLGADVVFQ